VNFRWDDNNDKLPDKVAAFGATPIFIKFIQSVITHGGPNENKVNGIFIFQVSTSTQLIFPWYSETSNPIAFPA
jgi:hypothetical protein